MSRISLIILIVMLVAAGGYWATRASRGIERRIAPAEALPSRQVTVGSGVIARDVSDRGKVVYGRSYRILSPVAGRLRACHLREGQRVDKDDLLVELDDSEYQEQRRVACKKLMSMEHALSQIRAGAGELALSELRLQLKQARQQLRQADEKATQLQQMYDRGMVARQEVEQAVETESLAREAVAVAERRLSEAQAKSKPEELARYEAEVLEAKRQLEQLDKRIRRTRIASPIAGLITEVTSQLPTGTVRVNVEQLDEGDWICTISDPGQLQVELEVYEDRVESVGRGAPVSIRLEAGGPIVGRGVVEQVSQLARSYGKSAKYPVVVTLRQWDPQVRVGRSVWCQITGDRRQAVAMVPIGMVHYAEQGHWCWVLRQGRAERQRVELGVDDGRSVEIIRGLEVGDRIVDRPESAGGS